MFYCLENFLRMVIKLEHYQDKQYIKKNKEVEAEDCNYPHFSTKF